MCNGVDRSAVAALAASARHRGVSLRRYCLRSAVVALGVVLCTAIESSAQVAPPLGSAQSFAVLGASTVTNTGGTTVTGDLGVSPGTAVTGFPPGAVVSGSIHSADAVAAAAQSAATIAYNDLAGQPCNVNLTGQDLGGLTLTPGVYCFSSSAQLTGTLTLDAQGNPNAVFIFQIGSTLITASGSSVVMINPGAVCDLFWQVGSSATLGTGTSFAGNIIALASITLTTGAHVSGRTFAQNGAVTMDTNAVTVTCPGGVPPVCPTITVSPATLVNGTVGVAYSQTLTGSGGVAPYGFSLTSGTLPAGTTLNAAGVLSGTPTAAGTSNFTIRAADANACPGTRAYTLVVAAAPPVCTVITLSPASLPGGTVAIAYNQTITASGGTAPYGFTLSAGALPAGVLITAGGVVTGTPTAAGTFNFSIRATDANACPGTLAYSIVVAAAPPPPPVCPTITLSPALLAAGTVGVAYSQTVAGNGGLAPYSFGVTAGTLPTGLTLTAGGVLAGTPTTAGDSTFTIRATDANACFAALSFTMSLPTPVPSLPQAFLLLLAAGLTACGYLRLRSQARAK